MSSTSAESERTAQSARRHESHRPPSAARPYVSPLREAASTKAVHAEILAGPRHSRGSRHFTAPHWRRRGRRKGKGVSVGDYLIGHGYLTADTLYRCVAQHLGVPFLSRKLPLRDHIDPHTAARQGFAPLVPQHARGARAVVASRSRTRTADQPRARHSESADAFRHHPAPLSARCSGPFLLWLFLDALFGPLLAPQSTSEIIDSTIWCASMRLLVRSLYSVRLRSL